MEVVRAGIGAGNVERRYSLSFDVNDAVLNLEQTCDQKESGTCDNDAVALEHIGSENDVGDAGFIFKREKDEAFCRAWALASDHATGNPDKMIVATLGEFLR